MKDAMRFSCFFLSPFSSYTLNTVTTTTVGTARQKECFHPPLKPPKLLFLSLLTVSLSSSSSFSFYRSLRLVHCSSLERHVWWGWGPALDEGMSWMENGRLSLVTVLRTFSLSIAVIVVCSLMNARQRRLLDDMSHVQLLASGNKREEKKNQ